MALSSSFCSAVGRVLCFCTTDPRVHPYPLNQLLFKPGKRKNEGKNGHLEWFYSIITFPGVLGVDSPYPLGPLVFSLKRTSFSVLMQWASSIRCAGLKYSALVLNTSFIFKWAHFHSVGSYLLLSSPVFHFQDSIWFSLSFYYVHDPLSRYMLSWHLPCRLYCCPVVLWTCSLM